MEEINGILCGFILPITLFLVGIIFLFRLRFFYVLKPFSVVKSIICSRDGFSSLAVALAGTLGIGNIVGVASAILAGGYGSIFWMWISAFLSMGIKYAEVFLGMKYRKKQGNEHYGGAPYYIKEGVKEHHSENTAFAFGSIFAFLCVLNSFTTGNLVQINAVSSFLPIPPICFGITFSIFGFLIVKRGIKRISAVSSILIPILSLFYIALCIIILFKNAQGVPLAFEKIFKSAVAFRPAVSGVFGFTIKEAIRYGTSRGLLSNEAGCGTSPSAHASSKNESAHAQACLGVFEVFFDTIVLCSLTALVIIVSPLKSTSSPLILILSSFEGSLGAFGKWGVIASCILFAFATILTQYFYGLESLKFITKTKNSKLVFLILFFVTTILGSVIPMSLMWQLSDFFLAIMTLFNLSFLIYLRKKVAI